MDSNTNTEPGHIARVYAQAVAHIPSCEASLRKLLATLSVLKLEGQPLRQFTFESFFMDETRALMLERIRGADVPLSDREWKQVCEAYGNVLKRSYPIPTQEEIGQMPLKERQETLLHIMELNTNLTLAFGYTERILPDLESAVETQAHQRLKQPWWKFW